MAAKLVLTNPIVTIATTDYSDEVSSIAVPFTQDSLNATVSNSAGWREVEGGEKSSTVDLECVFLSDMSTGLLDYLRDNFGSKVAFTAKAKNAAVAAANPEVSGTIHLNSLPFGGAVNQLHTATVSFPTSGAVTWADS